ncbi:MAG: glycosyltransferase family 39 protein [Candidatus Aenigmarchaeota archaeon]|nr:glycosyltransferase family 39 protein [Candidatus Aenigmarchaeota archaeon]
MKNFSFFLNLSDDQKYLIIFLTGFIIVFILIAYTWMSFYNLLDAGRWHNEVDRLILGEIPYKDYTWQYPPLSLYILGIFGIVFGSNFLTMYIATSTVAFLAYLIFFLILKEVKREEILFISLSTLMMGSILFSFSMLGTLFSSGTYAFPVTFGILFSLITIYGSVKFIKKQNMTNLLITSCGAISCLLTKQDFFLIPISIGAYLTYIFIYANNKKENIRLIFLYWILIIFIPLFSYLYLSLFTGLDNLIMGVKGFSDLRHFTRVLPTLRSLFDQIAMSSLIISGISLVTLFFGKIKSLKDKRNIKNLAIVVIVIALFSFFIISFNTYMIVHEISTSGINSFKEAKMTSRATLGFYSLEPTNYVLLKTTFVSVLTYTIIFEALPGVSLMIISILFLVHLIRNKESYSIRKDNIYICLIGVAIISLQARKLFDSTADIMFLIAPIFIILSFIEITKKINFDVKKVILIICILWLIAGSLYFSKTVIYTRIRGDFNSVETQKGNILTTEKGVDEIYSLIMTETKKDDFLLALPYHEYLNYITSRRSPSKITQFYILKLSNEYEKELIEILRSKKPYIAIDEKYSYFAGYIYPNFGYFLNWEPMFYEIQQWRLEYPELWNYINENYKLQNTTRQNWTFWVHE